MKLPNHPNAIVPRAKIVDYLLSPIHRDGRSKAMYFTRFGFSTDDWEVFADALMRHAAEHEVAKVEPSRFGTRYLVEGIMNAPNGNSSNVRSVWFIENGEQSPRFVTAYPLKRRSQ